MRCVDFYPQGSLVGHSDNNGDEDTGHLHVTYHHNYWTNVNSRLPSIRFGTGHIYSSCFEENPTSGINSRMGANVLVEDCYFLDTKDAMCVFPPPSLAPFLLFQAMNKADDPVGEGD